MAIRVDDGPKYVSGTLVEWAKTRGVALSQIQPGKPDRTPMSNAITGRFAMNSSTSTSSKHRGGTGFRHAAAMPVVIKAATTKRQVDFEKR